MDVSIKDNTKAVLKDLGNISKKQIPFATAAALTKTAQSAQKALKREAVKKIDKPTPFTLRGFRIKRATKRTLTAEVFIADIQSDYMTYAIEGGTRTPKKRAIIQPGAIKLNKYGNLPKNAINRIMARRDTFSGSRGGVPGIYQRTKRGMKLLIAYVKEQTYEGGQFDFNKVVIKTTDLTFDNHMKIALIRAMRTAK